MSPSQPLGYPSAFLAFFFHQDFSPNESSFATGMHVQKTAKSNYYFCRGFFFFHPVGRTDLIWTQENYYAKTVPRTGKVLSHPH